jgi:hypothetical protein
MKYECSCKFVNSPCVIESNINLEAAPSGNPPFFCAFGFYGESLWKARQEISENLQTSTNKQSTPCKHGLAHCSFDVCFERCNTCTVTKV